VAAGMDHEEDGVEAVALVPELAHEACPSSSCAAADEEGVEEVVGDDCTDRRAFYFIYFCSRNFLVNR